MKRDVIADSQTLDGRYVQVVKLTHDLPQPNGSKESFAVDVSANADIGAQVFGFVSQDDAERFMTTFGHGTFTTYDRNNEPTDIIRQGLGILKGMVRQYESADVASESTAREVNAPKQAENQKTAGQNPADTAPTSNQTDKK